ncbi:hypothetical protein HBN54_002877 [Hymenobacter sp. 1B]|uniref:Uncharacterized protein n=1 Tax=Hymenobacter artigasi TaxID=2719616 RepID=A0ABX1HMM7_9BACT|nr:hypothetical protein [Hymenobacter artigasi]
MLLLFSLLLAGVLTLLGWHLEANVRPAGAAL